MKCESHLKKYESTSFSTENQYLAVICEVEKLQYGI